MSTSPSIDPEQIEAAKQQIRGLTQEIERLSRAEVAPSEFFGQFLENVVAALAAAGGAIWILGEANRLNLAHQVNLQETGLAESEANQARHGQLLLKARQSNEGLIAAPGYESPDRMAGNPTDFLVLLAPLKSDQDFKGLVEIFQRPGARPAVERGYLRFLLQMCELAGDYLKTRALRSFTDRQALWGQLETFTRTVHQSLDARLAAYTIANEGRRLIECDRVTVAIRRGRKCSVEAVSGQETFDRRSTTITLLGNLATTVAATGEPVWYTGDTTDLAPQVEDAIQSYVDESHSKTVAVLPLSRPPTEQEAAQERDNSDKVIGALIVEQIEESQLPESFRHRVAVVCDHSSTALANALEHQNLFLMPVWKALGRARWVFAARTLPKTALVAGSILLLGAILALVPADFNLEGRGTLEPVQKRDVFAGIDGVVHEIPPYVEHGAAITAGTTLVQLRNTDLDVEIADVDGRLKATHEQIVSIQRSLSSGGGLSREEQNRLSGQLMQLRKTERSLVEQQKHLLDKKKQLEVASPITGQIITWNVREDLVHRPVERGQVLLTVADTSQDWQLEIHMPESRMGHIGRAQASLPAGEQLDVTYILATDPGVSHQGKVKEIHAAAEVRGEEGNTVLIKVAIDQRDLLGAAADSAELSQAELAKIRPGATVTAKIHCGRRSIGYVWFHDLIAFVQSRILFKL